MSQEFGETGERSLFLVVEIEGCRRRHGSVGQWLSAFVSELHQPEPTQETCEDHYE